MRIFVVGSFVVACSVKVARLPRSGESLDAHAFVSEPGGKGFNLALAAHRLGAAVDGAFAIGSDSFAAVAVSAFEQSGLSARMLVEHDGSTGAGVGFIDAAGENCLAVSLGANRLLSASDIAHREADLDRADLVMATFESPDEPIAAAFGRARARGTRTLLNPSPSRPIDASLLADTSILVVNRLEAGDLGVDMEDPQRSLGVERLLNAGPEMVVVTLGQAGAVAFRRDGAPCARPSFEVPVVDTIGAGDAFAAGFAVALLQDRTIDDALARASACAAITVRRFGAFAAFPTADGLERFLATVGF